MIVYHGSNLAVEKPMLLNSARSLDFGSGFYTTMNLEQAKNFAHNVVNRNEGLGIPTVSFYEVDIEMLLREYNTLKFDTSNDDWLDFVYANRTTKYAGERHDLVIGPVANDTLYRVFRLFENGDIDRETVKKRLKIVNLYNQIAFCTDKVICALHFIKSEVEKNE